MSFVCPDCLRPGSLTITHRLELPPDSAWDELTIQVVACTPCSFRGVALYRESRRGALDSEHWDHTGYRLSEIEVQSLQQAIAECPSPTQPRCGCQTHRWLGHIDPQTRRWAGMSSLTQQLSFPMRRA